MGSSDCAPLQYFYDGIFQGQEFALRDVQPQFEGKTYRTLSAEERRGLDDSILHATIVKQDEPSEDDSSVYLIFERLNTGGLLLRPQEIRACIFHGQLNDLIHELNKNAHWRNLSGGQQKFQRDEELILRFFALYFDRAQYDSPMKGFLNLYMGSNRDLTLQSKEKLTHVFAQTVDAIHESIGKAAFKPQRTLNAAVYDAVMVGIAKRLEKGPVKQREVLKDRYKALLENVDFKNATEAGTSRKDNVEKRVKLAIDAFAHVK